jgi:hypothetical protein
MTKHFHICCDGSFGNRYSGLVGGLTLARLCGLAVKISWPSTNMCRALFTDLFESVNIEILDWRLKEFYSFADQYDFISVNDQHMRFFGKTAIDPENMNLDIFRQVVENSQLNIFYYTPLLYDWIPQEELDLTIKNLVFNHNIMNEVNQFRKENGLSNYSGIHLRMTDFVNIESFDVDHWINIVRNASDQKFFVCSDDPATEERFNELPNAFSYPKKYKTEKFIPEGNWHHPYVDEDGRSTVFNVERGTEHVKEAVIDFLLLSLSNPFETGKQSTFLKMAKRIGSALKS